MKILKNEGTFEILTPIEFLRLQGEIIEKAGRTCYQSERGPITPETAARFVKRLMRSGHVSVIEHSLLTVLFRNVSRGYTHEKVRHRLCAFSQESTRYVDYAPGSDSPDLERFQAHFVVPPHRDENEPVRLEDGRMMSASEMLAEIERFYRALRLSGWLPEDARQLLPQAIKADIVVSTNFRQWRHMFEQRTQKSAHWEIRKVMGDLLVYLQGLIPVIFADFVEAGLDKNGLRYFKRVPIE